MPNNRETQDLSGRDVYLLNERFCAHYLAEKFAEFHDRNMTNMDMDWEHMDWRHHMNGMDMDWIYGEWWKIQIALNLLVNYIKLASWSAINTGRPRPRSSRSPTSNSMRRNSRSPDPRGRGCMARALALSHASCPAHASLPRASRSRTPFSWRSRPPRLRTCWTVGSRRTSGFRGWVSPVLGRWSWLVARWWHFLNYPQVTEALDDQLMLVALGFGFFFGLIFFYFLGHFSLSKF